MKSVKTKIAKVRNEEQQRKLISVLAEISSVAQRLAERLAFVQWRQSNRTDRG